MLNDVRTCMQARGPLSMGVSYPDEAEALV